MEFFPQLRIGWLNGWIYFVFYIIVFALTMSKCPEEVRKRLYDRSSWDKKTKIITAIGKSLSLINIVMIFFSKLQVGNIEFVIGTILYVIGLIFLVLSIINYRDAPLNEPIMKGVYEYSRNPQMVSIYILFTGMCLTIGSWFNLVLLSITVICSHFSILGEEASLEEQYGDSYLEYKKKVPRYFIFF